MKTFIFLLPVCLPRLALSVCLFGRVHMRLHFQPLKPYTHNSILPLMTSFIQTKCWRCKQQMRKQRHRELYSGSYNNYYISNTCHLVFSL